MPFSQRIVRNVGKVGNVNNIIQNVECLMAKQTKYVYKKVELGSLINKETIREEIVLDMESDRVDDDSRDANPYKELKVNNAIKVENALSQMEQWSILNNIINYVQYSKNPKDFYTMTVKPVNNGKCNLTLKDKNKDDMSLRVDLTNISKSQPSYRSKEKYLDRYEGVISEILNTTRFDENTDLSTTYLGKLRMTQGDNLNVEERFSITIQ